MTSLGSWRGARFSLATLTGMFVLAGCGGTEHWTAQWGPGPSAGISVATIDAATFWNSPVVHCEGPAAELAELGSLCSTTSDAVTLVADAGDVGFIGYYPVGTRYNAIVVFGYYGDADAAVTDHTADIRYAARLLLDVGMPRLSVAHVERDVALWNTGDELTGNVATWRAIGDEACYSEIFAGVATFQWKSSTITLRFNAGWPC